jgi:hypothetical protein
MVMSAGQNSLVGFSVFQRVVGAVLFFKIRKAFAEMPDFSNRSSPGLICAMRVSNFVMSISSVNSQS